MSPWMNNNANNFIIDMRAALARGVVIKIHYGINSWDKRRDESEQEKNFLRNALNNHPNLKFKFGHEHSKIFICDDKFYVIGSLNVLSHAGNLWGEIAELSTDKNNLLEYRKYFFNF